MTLYKPAPVLWAQSVLPRIAVTPGPLDTP